MEWRKSTFSPPGLDCVEVAWRRSSASDAYNQACVEVASCACGGAETLVRDSKNATGPRLAFGDRAWRGLLATARRA